MAFKGYLILLLLEISLLETVFADLSRNYHICAQLAGHSKRSYIFLGLLIRLTVGGNPIHQPRNPTLSDFHRQSVN